MGFAYFANLSLSNKSHSYKWRFMISLNSDQGRPFASDSRLKSEQKTKHWIISNNQIHKNLSTQFVNMKEAKIIEQIIQCKYFLPLVVM